MKKTRKEKLIEEIETKLREIEDALIDVPYELSSDEYQELIEEAKLAMRALEILKKM